jgi:hypothetical protein
MHSLVSALPSAVILWGMIMRAASGYKITVTVERRT